MCCRAGAAMVRAWCANEDIAQVREQPGRINVTLAHAEGQAVAAQWLRSVPRASTELITPALGERAGGPIALDPGDRDGRQAREPRFEIELRLPDGVSAHVGARAWVELPSRRGHAGRTGLAVRAPLVPAPLQTLTMGASSNILPTRDLAFEGYPQRETDTTWPALRDAWRWLRAALRHRPQARLPERVARALGKAQARLMRLDDAHLLALLPKLRAQLRRAGRRATAPATPWPWWPRWRSAASDSSPTRRSCSPPG